MSMTAMTLAQLEELAGNHTKHSASDVKSRWRDIVDEANNLGEVIVTSYNKPEVVVVSIDHYAKLKKQAKENDPMAKIRADLDRELAWLKEPGAGDKLRAVFNLTPEEIAQAVNARLNR
jgi:prevent-host-death family protein